MRPARRRALALLVAATALACRDEGTVVVSPPARPPASAQVEQRIEAVKIWRKTDAPAPALDLPTLDGGRFNLAQAKGQVVFVNFWATWCPPCRDEMPSMLALGKELEARYPGRFKMVAVSADDGWAPVREFFAAPPYGGSTGGVTVVLDRQDDPGSPGGTTKAYYCAARKDGCPPRILFPETYVVSKEGRIVGFFEGPEDWSRPVVRSWLEGLIGS